jgi:hypothetical protein
MFLKPGRKGKDMVVANQAFLEGLMFFSQELIILTGLLIISLLMTVKTAIDLRKGNEDKVSNYRRAVSTLAILIIPSMAVTLFLVSPLVIAHQQLSQAAMIGIVVCSLIYLPALVTMDRLLLIIHDRRSNHPDIMEALLDAFHYTLGTATMVSIPTVVGIHYQSIWLAFGASCAVYFLIMVSALLFIVLIAIATAIVLLFLPKSILEKIRRRNSRTNRF